MKIILVDAWNTLIKEKKIDNDLFKILESFSCKKIILTNASEKEKKKFGIINMPYDVFSLNHNPEKTHSKYFEILISKYDLNLNDLYYIEHNIKAYNTATLFGIKSLHYDGNNLKVRTFLENNLHG